jgi:hypothetical protein
VVEDRDEKNESTGGFGGREMRGPVVALVVVVDIKYGTKEECESGISMRAAGAVLMKWSWRERNEE